VRRGQSKRTIRISALAKRAAQWNEKREKKMTANARMDPASPKTRTQRTLWPVTPCRALTSSNTTGLSTAGVSAPFRRLFGGALTGASLEDKRHPLIVSTNNNLPAPTRVPFHVWTSTRTWWMPPAVRRTRSATILGALRRPWDGRSGPATGPAAVGANTLSRPPDIRGAVNSMLCLRLRGTAPLNAAFYDRS
jgi:hypothetical protein